MSDNTVEIIENNNILEITSSTESETSVVEIVQSGVVNLEMSTNVALLPSSFEDNTKIIISETLVGDSGIVIGPLTSGNIIISTSGLQPSGDYSLVGHTHNSSDITNFNSSVSGLLPVKNISAGSGIGVTNNSGDFTVSVTGTFGLTGEQVDDRVNDLLKSGSYVNLDYNDSLDSLTISVTGLQPSGNYSLVGHSHDISDINNLQNALDSKQPSGVYASGVHYHISSDITDFNNSVSGLLPVKNISSGSGISVINNSGNFTVAVTGTFGLTSEEVDDRVNDLLIAGSNIVLNYNDLANQLTISTSGLQPSGNYSVVGHSHMSSDITDFNSSVSGILPVTNISAGSYTSISSSSGNFTISVTGVQPSGNYSVVGHSHTSNDITDFSSSVNTLISGIYAPLNSPAFTGVPTVPTAPSGTNDTQIANTSFVRTEISNLVDSAPITLDTLNELAAALGDDPNFATTVTNLIGDKVSKSGDTMSGTLYAPSGVFSSGLTLNGTTVSVSGHTHSYTDITNWASGIDDTLSTLLVAGNYIDINYDTNFDTLTISATGLQPSGNYSIIGHSHTTGDITDFNSGVSGLLPSVSGSGYVNSSFVNNIYTISVSGLQPSGNYANSIHTHSSSDISDFNSSVSGLLPITNISSGSYINVSQSGTTFTVSATGLQPSGNYSVVGHNHTSSDITDFNSSVSGLLPVKDIIAGNDISISSSSGIYTINSTVTSVDEANSLVTTVFNKTGSTIPKMSVVYINGGQGDMPTVQLAIATTEATSSKTYGVTAEAIDHMSSGKVVVDGALTGLNTDQFNPTAPTGDVNGTVVYLSPSVSGAITTTKPYAPNHLVSVGTIVRTHQNEGVIEVKIQNGFELQELHNVAVTGVNNGEFLQYNSTSNLWVPTSSGNFTTLQVNGTGVSVSGHTHTSSNITDFNSSVSGLFPSNIVTGTGLANHVAYWSNSGIVSADSGQLYWDSTNNRLGIGTVSPQRSLHVAGTNGIVMGYNSAQNVPTRIFADSSDNLNISSDLNTNKSIILNGYTFGNTLSWSWNNATNDKMTFSFSPQGWVAPPTPSIARYTGTFPYTTGTWRFLKIEPTVSQGGSASFTDFYINRTQTSAGSGLQYLIDAATNSVSRFNVTNSGDGYFASNLGIGTTTPSGRLHVAGGSGLFSSVTSGIAPNALLHAYSATSGDTVFNVEGTNGSLFSVIDSLSGSLMSVNNNAGLPIFEVFSDDSIVAGRYNLNDFVISSSGNVGIGSVPTSHKIQVSGNMAVSGLIISTSGNYINSLQVNGTNVSISGHTHTSSNITDFNSSVSGLLPTIANSGDNRVLTSTGTTTGTNAESNLTFDGSTLNIDGNLVFDSFTESVIAIGNSSTSQTLSIGSGTVQTCTLTGNCTFTMPSLVAGKSFTLFLNTGAGNYTASFSGVLWSDSAPITVTTIANKVDILSFISDGSYWYGSYSQNYG